jgi:hypothetical protein
MAAQANLRRERELAERRVSSEREKELAEAHAAIEDANWLQRRSDCEHWDCDRKTSRYSSAVAAGQAEYPW